MSDEEFAKQARALCLFVYASVRIPPYSILWMSDEEFVKQARAPLSLFVFRRILICG